MPPPTTLGYGLVGTVRLTPRPKVRLGRTTVGIPMKVRVRKYHGQSPEIATLGCSGPRAVRSSPTIDGAGDHTAERRHTGAGAHHPAIAALAAGVSLGLPGGATPVVYSEAVGSGHRRTHPGPSLWPRAPGV